MTCLQDKTVKTRKEHFCSGCYKTFPPKRILRYQVGIFEGEFYSLYVCNPCIKEISKGDYIDGYSEGELREGRTENVRNWQHKRMNKLEDKANEQN